MFERRYRQRLDRDLARWQGEGLVTPASCEAIRAALGPMPKAIDLASVVAIVGGLLIAAAFLAFVAANWSAVARPARFAILVAGIAASFGLGAFFARSRHAIMADLCAAAGSIIFGAAIALTGQMYHLGGDFAGGMMLWALGALAAAVLTGSRGALAVALVTGCIWSGMRSFEDLEGPHLVFIAFWLVAAALAVIWNAAVARHLVAAAAIAWWVMTATRLIDWYEANNPMFTVAAGGALLFGTGLAMAARGPETTRLFGLTLSTYAAFALAIALAVAIAGAPGSSPYILPGWMTICGVAGIVLALIAAGLSRSIGPALGAVSLALALAAMALYVKPSAVGESWASYALALLAMLALVASGMLDDVRPRVVAGWIGLAAVIAAITWAVKGSLLNRALFLAVAGAIAIALAMLVGRVMPKEAAR